MTHNSLQPLPLGRVRNPYLLVTVLALLLASSFIFSRLGHYSFWDDEAYTALLAKSFLRHGDTLAMEDGNLLAVYANGGMFKDLKERVTPPLSTWMAAFSMRIFGETTFAARLPSAICGVLTLLLLLFWMQKRSVPLPVFAITAIGLALNVSFILYSRQARYFSLVGLLSLLAAYFYIEHRGRKSHLLLLAASLAGLFASHQLSFAVVAGCMAVDYLLWQRRVRPLRFSEILLIGIPLSLVCATIFAIWNPFASEVGNSLQKNTWADRWTLFSWYWRDLNVCEFFSLFLLAVAPLLYLRFKHQLLLRLPVLLGISITIASALTIQNVPISELADVRYLSIIIPAGVFLSAYVLFIFARRHPIALWALAALLIGSNLFYSGIWGPWGLRSTIGNYLAETINPPADPYKVASTWMKDNLAPGTSVLALPSYMNVPLLFHAPQFKYVWQLNPPVSRQFQNIDPAFIKGSPPPEYVIAFGPQLGYFSELLKQFQVTDYDYKVIGVLNYFWKDVHRPELFWRSNHAITNFDPKQNGITILQRVPKQ